MFKALSIGALISATTLFGIVANPSSAQNNQSQDEYIVVGAVTTSNGPVYIKRPGQQNYRQLMRGEELSFGDLVFTSNDVRAIVQCTDETFVYIPNGVISGARGLCPESRGIAGRERRSWWMSIFGDSDSTTTAPR